MADRSNESYLNTYAAPSVPPSAIERSVSRSACLHTRFLQKNVPNEDERRVNSKDEKRKTPQLLEEGNKTIQIGER